VARLGNIVTTLEEYNDHYGYTFCWFWGSLVSLWGQLGCTIQKFITNSCFVKKMKLFSPFLDRNCLYVYFFFKNFNNINRTNQVILPITSWFTLRVVQTTKIFIGVMKLGIFINTTLKI